MIYWDNNATTPVADEVLDAMLPYLKNKFMNPSAGYQAALDVRRAVDEARSQVASLMGADPDEIIFTSGATESINTVLSGMLQRFGSGSIMGTTTDHDAVLHALAQGNNRTLPPSTLCPVDQQGVIDQSVWKERLASGSVCGVSLTWANNETGVIQDVLSLAQLAHEAGALVHVDGVQALGKIPVDLHRVDVDFASFSAHKMHGPKGVGALYVKRGAICPPLLYGGGQERGMRSGTEHVPGIIGFGVAAQLAARRLQDETRQLESLRNSFEECLLRSLDHIRIMSSAVSRTPNTSCIAFGGCTAQALLLLLEPAGLLCSAGSACSTSHPRPSHVLTAMGLSDEEARSCVRFSLSSQTTIEEVELAAGLVINAVRRVRLAQSSRTGPVLVYRP